ncbi:MAG TPA: MOSC domain-containing protein [Rhizomicrobium sp.]|nr:MOSC domain-containing protein [Rhizomicrobium sp.]
MDLRIVSVNVAQPRIIARVNGEAVESAIGKIPVEADNVFVGRTNLEGDRQADLTVHGGPDKAVYAYPVDHWPWWQQKGFNTAPAMFGENLTVVGATEDGIHIGDRFRWGDALLEVSQPRGPCYKFAIHTARADAPQLMTVSSRCGWYLRVVEEGRAPGAGGLMTRMSIGAGNPSVAEAFRALYHPRISREVLQMVHDTPALASAWRDGLANRLKRSE